MPSVSKSIPKSTTNLITVDVSNQTRQKRKNLSIDDASKTIRLTNNEKEALLMSAVQKPKKNREHTRSMNTISNEHTEELGTGRTFDTIEKDLKSFAGFDRIFTTDGRIQIVFLN